MWGDIMGKYREMKKPGHYKIVATKLMIPLLIVRIASIVYLNVIKEVPAGAYGYLQMPFMYPFYFVLLMLCFIYIFREDLQHIGIMTLHIFTLIYMSFDVLFYILSLNPESWDAWIF